MAYLVAHIAIFLVFAQLMGLLLGWLLWGYLARQRGREVESLRERLADVHLTAHRPAITEESRVPLPEKQASLIEGDLPEAEGSHPALFLQAEEEPLVSPLGSPSDIAPDLQEEVKNARIQHLQQQLQELEGLRNRLPLLQADLSDAIAARHAAERRVEEAKSDFEARSGSMLGKIRDLESAASRWDRHREEFERAIIAKEKELTAVRAQLRDLQNSQRPEIAESMVVGTPSSAESELADLRDRQEKATKEREALAAEVEFWKQKDNARASDAGYLAARIAELEEALHTKDANLQEQVTRVETLLWRVAELEPFAAEAPRLEEDLRRQESEIAGHMSMHAESSEKIRALQNHISELESETARIEELKRVVTDKQAEIQRLQQSHTNEVAELQQSLKRKDSLIDEQSAERDEHLKAAFAMQARISNLEAAVQKVAALEKSLDDRDTEIRGLLAAYGDMNREMESWRDRATELEPVANKTPELEKTINEREAELSRLKDVHNEKEGQVTVLEERLAELSAQLAVQQQRLLELEPLAARTPVAEQMLSQQEEESRKRINALEERHQSELTRLKVNSAQRIRRLRQSITNFKG